ncbi:MAG: DNA-3-methyladenine glycosylase 2 family protein [Ruminococcaceae bacterium]|nr:DNA-3-methyladenine glycosylase 2 family protein [Oscillospiraceae bacterium]
MIVTIKDFVPEHTFDCGQCFRWEKQADGSYIGIANSQAVRISAQGEKVTIDGITEEDYSLFWKRYLDAERDYSTVKNAVNINETMDRAVKFGNGIRILRQDFFEALISFIISQRSSIPKIKNCVDKLCRLYGEEIVFDGNTYYAFPTPEKIASLTEDEIRALGVGYRAPYILKAAKAVANGEIDESVLDKLDTPSAREKLLSLYGVGDKVCDCVLLFSLGKYDLFPADVWIKRVMEEEFDSKDAKALGESQFGSYSGFAQQYLFYWRKYNV